LERPFKPLVFNLRLDVDHYTFNRPTSNGKGMVMKEIPFNEFNKMDVVMITKNSIKPCLRQTLESIVKEIPINNLIVVDGGSTDGTTEFLRNYGDKNGLNVIILVDRKGNRATSRQIGISKVETPMFAFIDSDVILTRGWFNKIMKYFHDPDTGAVWGAAIPIEPKSRKYYEAMARFYKRSLFEVARRQGLRRGMLHDTVIRKNAIDGIKIPSKLHVMEDHYVRMYIEKKNYKWISTVNPYCLHYLRDREPKEAYFDAYYGWKLGVYEKRWYTKHVLLSWAKIFYLLLITYDIEVVKYEFKKEWQFMAALLSILSVKKNLIR